MPHTIALSGGAIAITPEGGTTAPFAETARAAEFLAQMIVLSGVAAVARDASLAAPAAHGRPGFRYERFIALVRERAVMIERAGSD